MITSTQTALWVPGWYELDQTLVLGQRQKLWFFITPPNDALNNDMSINDPSGSDASDNGPTPDFVFFNQLDSTTNCQIRFATVVEMLHPQIGPLQRIDTDGCDYLFFPVDGEEIVVNAEEEPGQVYDDRLTIDQWVVNVTLEEVSDPVVDAV